jgi:uncharacterized iron-regulated membrane protein
VWTRGLTLERVRLRRKLLFIHRWTGLLLALYAIVIGLTGAILMFREELAPLARPQVSGGPLKTPVITTPDEVLRLTQDALPGWRALSVTWPHEHSPNFHVFCLKGADSRIAFVDAQSARLVGIIDPKADWLGKIEGIHSKFLLARPGRVANGYGGILTMLLSLTGIFIWWPNRQQWRAWFRLSGRRTWWRVFWDFHHLVGVAAFALLLVIALTGTYFTWGPFFVKTVSSAFSRSMPPKLPAEPGEITNPTLQDLALMAQRAMPGPVIHRMAILEKRDRPLEVTLRDGAPHEFHLVSTVYLDPRTGDALKVKRLAERPAGDSILGYFAAVHFGVFGGWPIRWLWFLAGLATAGLSVTGVLLWWRALKRINLGR